MVGLGAQDWRNTAMRLTDILRLDCVKVPLAATAKQAAIFELVDLMAAAGCISNAEQLKAAVWQREMTRTTGIGHGIAIPHGKTTGCSRLVMAIGKPAQPIDFAAVDGRPVDLVILLASPLDQTGPHLQALAGISQMLSSPEFRDAVRRAATADELYQLIASQETKQPA